MYYLHFDNNRYGPYTEEQVRGMTATGNIPSTALVYDQKGYRQWQPLQNCPRLMRLPGKQTRNLVSNPSLSSMPITTSDIERTIWEGNPSNLTALGSYSKYFVIIIIAVAIVFQKNNFTNSNMGLDKSYPCV